MAALIASPVWFKGAEIVLEVFTMLVALGVVYAGSHAHRLTKDRRHAWFAIAFGLLSVSFAARLFTTLAISLDTFKDNVVVPVAAVVGTKESLFSLGHVSYIWIVLAAYAMLLALSMKWQRKREVGVLLALNTVIAAVCANVSWPFYMASLVYLFSIAMQYFLNYQEKKAKSAFWIFIAFSMLTLEPLLYLLAGFDPVLVTAAYAVRLVAYVLLLRTLWKVFNDE